MLGIDLFMHACISDRSDRGQGEKHCIRIPVAFRLYLVKIIQILIN
jgi:hypothetical protein